MDESGSGFPTSPKEPTYHTDGKTYGQAQKTSWADQDKDPLGLRGEDYGESWLEGNTGERYRGGTTTKGSSGNRGSTVLESPSRLSVSLDPIPPGQAVLPGVPGSRAVNAAAQASTQPLTPDR